jgi:hypothetical protein
MLVGMRSSTKPGRQRVDSVALFVAVVAVLLLLAAVGEALSLANAPQPAPPTVGPAPTLPVSALTATQAAQATTAAGDQRLAVTLAAVMQVTPGSVNLGISAVGTVTAPTNAGDFVAQNVWVGLVNDQWLSVYAGALRSDPQQGALLLLTVLPDRVEQERFVAPLSNGPLRISAQNVQRLTLLAPGGETYLFDVLAKRFVGSLTEYAETATPLPTTTVTATPTATVSPTTTIAPAATVTSTGTP